MLNTSCIHRNFFFFFFLIRTHNVLLQCTLLKDRGGERKKKNKQFFSNYSSGQGRTISFCKLSPRPVPSFDLINYYETIRSPLATSGLLIVSDPFTTIITRIGFIYLYIHISRTPILARQPMYNSIAQNRFRFDRGVRLVKASINDIACSDHQVKIEPLKILFWNSFDRLSNYRK